MAKLYKQTINFIKAIDRVNYYIGNSVLMVVCTAILIICLLFWSGPRILSKAIDVSWPNCRQLVHISNYNTVIVGVNGGLDFHPNPCLGSEARLGANIFVYANSGDPGFPRISRLGHGPLKCANQNRLVCYSFNYGYQAALYSIRQADLAGVHAPFWWLDVESINSWTNSIAANRADIMGMVYAFRNMLVLKPKLGIYTTANQWTALVGKWRINLPLWLGTGLSNSSSAAKTCRLPSIIGPKTIFAQYTLGNLDYDYLCL